MGHPHPNPLPRRGEGTIVGLWAPPSPAREEGTVVRLSKHRRVVVRVRAGETGYSFLIQNTASPMSPDHRSSGRLLVGEPFGVRSIPLCRRAVASAARRSGQTSAGCLRDSLGPSTVKPLARDGDHEGRRCVLRVSVWLASRSRRHASASEHLRHNPTVAGLSICVAS